MTVASDVGGRWMAQQANHGNRAHVSNVTIVMVVTPSDSGDGCDGVTEGYSVWIVLMLTTSCFWNDTVCSLEWYAFWSLHSFGGQKVEE